MATTRYKIAEQVLRIVNGGDPTEDSSIDIREVMLLVDQERDSIIKTEIMDWSYTKSTATAKGELEINGGWISQATVPLVTDSSRNGALCSGLDFSYISLPNDMGIQKVESCDTRFQKQGNAYRVKGTIKKTTYNYNIIEVVFKNTPKVMDKKYTVSFDFNLTSVTMSNESTTQHIYGGLRKHKIEFVVDTSAYDQYEHHNVDFVRVLINSPGFKKFIKDYDISYDDVGYQPTDSLYLDGIQDNSSNYYYTAKLRLLTKYGATISNFSLNGVGSTSTAAGEELDYLVTGGALLDISSATDIEDNLDIGFGWSIRNMNTSVNSSEALTTSGENSHGIGFIINDTMYTTDFVSPKTEVTYEDAIDKFILENADKIAKEQNIICKKGQEGVPLTGITYVVVFQEIFPRGGFDIKV